MGYLHIDNLYKNVDVLAFKEVYVLEKIHGTSAHIGWKVEEKLNFFSGGEKHENFVKLFDEAMLRAKFLEGGLRDAESMLDQLVAFCGDAITRQDAIDVFGLTGLETVAALARAIFSPPPPCAPST